MWLVSCRRQGMLTQGLAPDPKCKLKFHHPLLFRIYYIVSFVLGIVSIVLLLWMMGVWNRLGEVDSYQGVDGGTGGGYYLIFFLLHVLLPFVLSCPVSFFKWVEHDSCCVCFYVYYFFSLSLVPLPRSYGA